MTSARNTLTLDQLVAALDKGPGAEGYLHVLRSAEVSTAELERHSSWHEKHYTRNCIAQREAYELLLICYEPGQRTSIHDHDSQQAYIHPVTGHIVEERFEPVADGGLRQVSCVVLDKDSFSYLSIGHSIHRCTNPGPGRAMTLNLYARPLRKWKVYDERSGLSSSSPVGA